MTDDKDPPRPETDAELERAVRKEAKFTLAAAIGRMAGPGAMKGTSPITLKQQAAAEIENWLRTLAPAGSAELKVVLLRNVKESDLLLQHLEQPLFVLGAYCEMVLKSDYRLKELVREADVEWGQSQGQRPHFEREGSSPHPEDTYTLASVRKNLVDILARLTEGAPSRP